VFVVEAVNCHVTAPACVLFAELATGNGTLQLPALAEIVQVPFAAALPMSSNTPLGLLAADLVRVKVTGS